MKYLILVIRNFYKKCKKSFKLPKRFANCKLRMACSNPDYKENSRKFYRGEDCMQRHFYKHFQLPRHTAFLQDTFVTLIDKTNPRAPTKREDYWIHTLKGEDYWLLSSYII